VLDPDTADTIRLGVDEARLLGEATLRRIGYPDEEAAIITDQLIDNALCGYRFASLPRILATAEDEKTDKPRTQVRVIRETPVSALVDGGNKVGYVAAYRGAEVAIAKAKASGIAIVGVHNSYYSGRNAYYVEQIVNAGLVAIHTASAKPHVIPPGGRKPALGTNPFSIGFPSANGPVIYDIGTASVMWGEVLLMARLGIPCRKVSASTPMGSRRSMPVRWSRAAACRRSAATRVMDCRSRSRHWACSRVPHCRAAMFRITDFCSLRSILP
jgi:LDH2 family malate/lactate/ureidoglycolate dehydrogenase